MNKIYLIITLISGLLLSGCTAQYAKPDAVPEGQSAKINFSRSSSLWAAAMSAPIYVNNTFIGKVGNGGELSWIVRQGPVSISTSEGTATLVLEDKGATRLNFIAKAGQIYYVKIKAPYQMNMTAPLIGYAAFNLEMTNTS